MTIKLIKEILAKYPDDAELRAMRTNEFGYIINEELKKIIGTHYNPETNKVSIIIDNEV